MSIRIASHAGFCFGVQRAVDRLEKALEGARGTNRKVYTLGRIIHNSHYIEHVKSLGAEERSRADMPEILRRADEGDEITVVIRAHGELKDISDSLYSCAERNPAFTLIDGTCPYVRKVRDIARENSGDGRVFLILGNAAHPEVEGIMSCAEGEKYVFPDEKSLENAKISLNSANFCAKTLSIAAQTTQNLAEWKKSINFLRPCYKE